MNPTYMRDVFTERNNKYNLRNENHLLLPVAKTTTDGQEDVEYRGCFLRSTLPKKVKIPAVYFHSNGKNGTQILAPVDYAKFLLNI